MAIPNHYTVFLEDICVGTATSITEAHDLAAKMAPSVIGRVGSINWKALDSNGWKAGGGSLYNACNNKY